MTKEELLRHCRYNKGEEDCPFKEGDNRGFFWFAERSCLRMAVRDEDLFLTRRLHHIYTKRKRAKLINFPPRG